MGYLAAPISAEARNYRFNAVKITGNERIDPATILTYAGIARGQTVSSGRLNDAYQSIVNSGLFETVSLVPKGNTLVISVVEFPTINKVAFEGNKRIKDANLSKLVRSKSRYVYNPSIAESDAAALTEAYAGAGRYAATVTPKIIRRSNNRVDLVFEITEGKVTEIERLSFVGNRKYSDRRLRRVLETKQAGLLRALIKRDSFIADRLEFDKQVLTDFYHSRGFVDFQILSVNSELSRGRNGFFITVNLREGQQFKFGKLTTVSDLPEVDAAEFQKVIRIRSGKIYSPTHIENTIARMERLAIRKGLNFVRVEPRVTRNDRDLSLDVEFVLSRGPRIFVERIDIEGNATTLDRVVRRKFDVVEGDPFNPRQIRETAERIRGLGFFSKADVNARQGSAPDQVIVDVDVEEQPTGSLSFGASYGTDAGFGLSIGFSERNFLGRGQALDLSFNTSSSNAAASFSFREPAFLGRDVGFRLSGGYTTSKNSHSHYSTKAAQFGMGLEFPVSENGRLDVYYDLSSHKIFDVALTPAGNPQINSPLLEAEQAKGKQLTSAVGYRYSFDTRRTGLNPNAGVVLRFGQEFAGLGGDTEFIKTTALVGAETKVFNEEVTLRAVVEGGILTSQNGSTSGLNERFFLNGSKMRGFESGGLGPRDLNVINSDALGGNKFAVARFEAEFPIGLPEEYGLSAGVFYDIGSVWGLDDTAGFGGPVDDDLHWRSAVGISVFWTTAIGPLRFNFSKALQKESYDRDRSFELTVQTRF
ncbi:MAG: outer membrane protein assembly factor BamA [Rhodobacterales bacterium]|nr:MAG: outer membrane protein assembly factor BamA [Rhodobacterales bacterium]